MILVDSNVLIDVIETDPVWHDWSVGQIESAVVEDQAVINHVVIAEAAPRTGSLERFQDRLALMMIVVEHLSDDAAWLAGLAFQTYRRGRSESAPKAILADFLIGGHAQSLNARLLTRDPRFYRTYFPSVPLITPDKAMP